MCPFGKRAVEGTGGFFERGSMVCHCLVLETMEGLVVVDSGFGLDDVRSPNERIGRSFQLVAGFTPREDGTLLRQIEALGFSASDVRHIAVTHLDMDHAGGLADFPEARIHVHARELEAVQTLRRLIDHHRYRQAQWAHGPRWTTYEGGGETWEGFANVRKLEGVGEDVLLVPLFGHTAGHAGIVVPSPDGERRILHAGDAYFSRFELDQQPYCPPAIDLMQRALSIDETLRLDNQRRLRTLARKPGGTVDVINAHDPHYLARLQGDATVQVSLLHKKRNRRERASSRRLRCRLVSPRSFRRTS
jgi:glyoxylase-like metal-dependent hydrolase (beta-lactamase superfamily II)